MENSKSISENKNIGKFIFVFVLCLLFGILYFRPHTSSQAEILSDHLWQIQSIDTMKTSRDMARSELNNPAFDKKIEKEITMIKETGANYVALGTPYDEEFLPYLKRWMKLARKHDLHIWFRGNWSEWEGWFDYPKDMTPDEHIKKTSAFIQNHPELFENGDIFEACPECENAKHWPQPQKNKEYRAFLVKQTQSNKDAFDNIDKIVYSNIVSVIGGRAKEVLDKDTYNALDNVVTIDHYVKSPKVMKDYIDFFKHNYDIKVIVSEFGAPIPDLNGEMNEQEQANFIGSVFEEFYKGKDTVIGVNYYVSIIGTTPLLNDDYTPREAYEVVKNYFTPGTVKGTVKNALGDPMKLVPIKTGDGVIVTETDTDGRYSFVIPPRTVDVTAGEGENTSQTKKVKIEQSGSTVVANFQIEPANPDINYKTRMFLKGLFGN